MSRELHYSLPILSRRTAQRSQLHVVPHCHPARTGVAACKKLASWIEHCIAILAEPSLAAGAEVSSSKAWVSGPERAGRLELAFNSVKAAAAEDSTSAEQVNTYNPDAGFLIA